MTMPIDPVVIREKLERAEKLAQRQATAKRALVGLGWFAEHAINKNHPGQPDPNALVPSGGLGGPKAPQLIVAGSTSGVQAAAHYIAQAYMSHRASILEAAIRLAQADLAANEVTENASGR